MRNKAKIFGIILGVVIFSVTIAGLTYAFYTWESLDTNISGSSECFKINYINGQDITDANLAAISEASFVNGNNITIVEGMALTTVSIEIDSSCNVNGTGTILLNPVTLSDTFISGTSAGALKYKVVEYSSANYPEVSVDSLKGEIFTSVGGNSITSTESIEMFSMPLTSGKKKEYILIFYFDEVLISNDAATGTFHGTISARAVQEAI